MYASHQMIDGSTGANATAHPVNTRPRQTLGWMTPPDKLAEALQ